MCEDVSQTKAFKQHAREAISISLSIDVITSLFPSSRAYHVEFSRNQSSLPYIEGDIGERGK